MIISDIDCSLSLGMLLNKKLIVFLRCSIAFILIFSITTLICLFLSFESSPMEVYAIVAVNVLCLILLALLFYIIIKDFKVKKRIKEYLKDAVKLNAYCETIGKPEFGDKLNGIKIEVRFKYKGEKFKKVSTAKVFSAPKGYLAIYKKYGDREIKILYSSKYDEVLILKD